ncbi:hypothetical protein SprV_0200850600 [Sparganum proliferum]
MATGCGATILSPRNHQGRATALRRESEGSDSSPAEIYKYGGPQPMDHPKALFQKMWRQGQAPQDLKDAIIVRLYKRKVNHQLCDNRRGISLFNIAGKIFARIRLNRRTHIWNKVSSRKAVTASASGVSPTTVHGPLFADDCTLNATLEGNTQRSMDFFAASCDNFGLIINTEKTMVMHKPPPDAAYVAPQINVNGVQLQVADNLPTQAARSTVTPKSTIKWPAGFPRLAKLSAVCKTPSTHTPPPSTPASISSTTPSTSCTPTMLSPTHTPSPSASTTNNSIAATISKIDTSTADFFCQRCLCIFTSTTGLVGHLRIHLTETGRPVTGAPTYTRRSRLNFPHCARAFTHRMSLFGHKRIHKNLRQTTDGYTTSPHLPH